MQEIPPRAAWLRALYLELERVANHLGDLGALGNDAGFAFGLAQFSRLKEQAAARHPRGTRRALPAGRDRTRRHAARILRQPVARPSRRCLREIADEVQSCAIIYDEHEGVRDRFNGAGTVAPELAARLGLTGLAGRASGQAFDLRCDMPCEPYRPVVSTEKVAAPTVM